MAKSWIIVPLASIAAVVLLGWALLALLVPYPPPDFRCMAARSIVFVDIHLRAESAASATLTIGTLLNEVVKSEQGCYARCPVCGESYLVCDDVEQWRTLRPSERVSVACRGPHQGGIDAVWHISTFTGERRTVPHHEFDPTVEGLVPLPDR